MNVLSAVALGVAMGAVFGIGLEKSRVLEPGTIVSQMQPRTFLMVKIFLTALVVIGAPGRHRYAENFMGTTAECVIRFSDRPVLMVKRASEDPYRRVLVAFDGSEGAIRALHTALTIAPGAEFRVVHAWWPPHASLGGSEAARQAIGEENDRLKVLIKRAAEEAIASSPSPPAKLAIDMVENNPYLVMRNESTWPDLLVMGTHSKGRLATTITVGKLARHLLAEVTCDVLVSRP